MSVYYELCWRNTEEACAFQASGFVNFDNQSSPTMARRLVNPPMSAGGNTRLLH
jgi:hypothetical protein